MSRFSGRRKKPQKKRPVPRPVNANPPSTAAEFRGWLASPGDFYVVVLPGNKSMVMKVDDEYLEFFRAMLSQLNAVLGGVTATRAEGISATPAPEGVPDGWDGNPIPDGGGAWAVFPQAHPGDDGPPAGRHSAPATSDWTPAPPSGRHAKPDDAAVSQHLFDPPKVDPDGAVRYEVFTPPVGTFTNPDRDIIATRQDDAVAEAVGQVMQIPALRVIADHLGFQHLNSDDDTYTKMAKTNHNLDVFLKLMGPDGVSQDKPDPYFTTRDGEPLTFGTDWGTEDYIPAGREVGVSLTEADVRRLWPDGADWFEHRNVAVGHHAFHEAFEREPHPHVMGTDREQWERARHHAINTMNAARGDRMHPEEDELTHQAHHEPWIRGNGQCDYCLAGVTIAASRQPDFRGASAATARSYLPDWRGRLPDDASPPTNAELANMEAAARRLEGTDDRNSDPEA